ncbi:hypothetical protein J3D45_000025 [Microbacterium foliorum]|nr:hypothetical protein [Microbacterium foliorum]
MKHWGAGAFVMGKYLENAALENRDQLAQIVATQIRRAGN